MAVLGVGGSARGLGDRRRELVVYQLPGEPPGVDGTPAAVAASRQIRFKLP